VKIGARQLAGVRSIADLWASRARAPAERAGHIERRGPALRKLETW